MRALVVYVQEEDNMVLDAMIKVDKNVPLPRRGMGNKRKLYPWNKLNVGDSFFVAVPKKADLSSVRASLVSGANQFRKRHAPEQNHTVRAVSGGVRVWRTQ